ncbi:hypothetical protein ACFX58_09710 [Sphingomonas sp. NCPPB 2930]
MSHGTPLDLGRGTAPRAVRGAARAVLTAAAALLATAVLAGVFMLYLQPEFLRALADQVWACL